jgi:sarcosine oxidase
VKRDFEVIVLGLGGLGSGALYWLARRLGGDVLGLERYELGHQNGGSQDYSRIIRYSYHRPAYVDLAKGAYDAWARLEEESGETLVVRTGGLDLFPPGGIIPLADYTESLEACSIPFELLDDLALARRWPQFRLPAGTVGLFQADGGMVLAADANRTHVRLARERGARILERAPVSGYRSVDGEIEVLVGSDVYRCAKLVITAGAWSNEALSSLVLPLTVTQEQVSYYWSPAPDDLRPGRLPIWIWMDEPCFYGFPYVEGLGSKVAQDVGGDEVTAQTRGFEPDPDGLRRVEQFLTEVLPGALGPVNYSKTCLYTLTPDRDFVIDRLPDQPNVLVAIGAGHAFKFASQIGRVLSELALDGETGADLTLFRVTRPILGEENPPHSFMV